jgi:hypothetical protein
MSDTPQPETDRTDPGSTPAPGARPNVELERQRAEGDLPGRPTRDPFHDGDDEDGPDARGERPDDDHIDGVDPTQSVPDETAEQAARDEDPNATGPGRDVDEDDPLHRGGSTSDAQGVPPGAH